MQLIKNPTREQVKSRYKPGYIYIVRVSGTSGIYKIGESINAITRQVQQEKKHNYTLEIIYTVQVKDCFGIEQSLHSMFSGNRLAGEWFAISDETINQLPSIIEKMDNKL